jgi:hypothetical protein
MKKFSLVFLLFSLFLIISSTASQAQYIYVDAEAVGSNDGSTWVNAYTDLQSALSVASSGNIIVVANGTYKPSVQVDVETMSTPSARMETFLVPDGVSIFGGFAGGEDVTLQSSYDTRDLITNRTILSGDLSGNDTQPTVNTAPQPLTITHGSTKDDNAYHVVSVLDATSVIFDGLTIQYGADDSPGGVGPAYKYGGGIYINSSVATATEVSIENCEFRWNIADRGAAIGAQETDAGASIDVTLINTKLYENLGYNYGAYHFQSGNGITINTTIINSEFYNNRTDYDGAGIMYIVNEGLLDIVNSLFYENDANRSYGGITFSALAATNATFSMVNTTVADNYGNNSQSGGLALSNYNTASVRNSIFYGNTINTANDYQIRVATGSLDIDFSLVQDGTSKINM